MPRKKTAASLQSYAFQLRKRLLSGLTVDALLDSHSAHQHFLERMSPQVKPSRLTVADRFAWRFITGINILDQNRLSKNKKTAKKSEVSETNGVAGIYQNIPDIVDTVRQIWFPDMTEIPRVCWLKQYTTRKLAHYHFGKDEIAFSLVFDFPDTPAEIMSYLAYHELLHRQIGAKRVNGRRYAHTTEFKHHEQLFPNWRQMDEQITRYLMSAYVGG